MMMLRLTRALAILSIFVLASCEGMVIHSSNEPKDDAAALRLVGINASPPPKVVFRAFEGGMDDNMRMVIRFPKSQLSSFWSASPWDAAERKELFPHKPGATILDQPPLPDSSEPQWSSWKGSSHGIYVGALLPKALGVTI